MLVCRTEVLSFLRKMAYHNVHIHYNSVENYHIGNALKSLLFYCDANISSFPTIKNNGIYEFQVVFFFKFFPLVGKNIFPTKEKCFSLFFFRRVSFHTLHLVTILIVNISSFMVLMLICFFFTVITCILCLLPLCPGPFLTLFNFVQF